MRIKEILTPMPETVKGITLIAQAAKDMKRLRISSIPVLDHGQVVGLLSSQDIIERSTAKGFDPTKTRVRDIMTTGEIVCRESQSIEEVIQQMDQLNTDQLIVLNESKNVMGIVSRDDILSNFPSLKY